ncbi:MAG: GTPase Era [Bacillales bacterium]|jgi:GTP-binding protein Era|nr:GTPase Era [Bacillales bacterium]
MFKSGFVSLIGRANVGKSTLLNQLINKHVAIVSDKPQTTRNKIHGILTTDTYQIVFIDTPGFHRAFTKLGAFMNEESEEATKDVDIILYLIDGKKYGRVDEEFLLKLKGNKAKVFLLINKIDQLNPQEVYKIIVDHKDLYDFTEIVPLSALKNRNVDLLKNLILKYLEEGPMYYPKEDLTDHDNDFLVQELIREKILHYTEKEVPHQSAVYVEKVRKNGQKGLEIQAVIVVERASQKGIVIGKGGSKLKEIGTKARYDIEKLLNCFINLKIFVKVEENWRDKVSLLKEYGYKQ